MPIAASYLPYLNRFRPLAFVLVLIAISAFAYAEPNLPLFLVGAAATLFAWWLVEGPRGKPLPRLMINLGVLAASAGLFVELVIVPENRDIRQANLLLALGHFMCGILLCKLFERKSHRDYAQILTLTLLIMVAGAIVATASLFFALLLAIYLGMGLYAILLFHLHSETERAVATNLASVEDGLFHDTPAKIRHDIRLVAGWSACLLVAIAAIAFLAVPRTPGREFLAPWVGSSFSTGFTEQVHMQDYVNLHQSEAVVMEVKLDQDGINPGSETYAPYFRGTVLDAYNTRTRNWVRSAGNEMHDLETYQMPSDRPLALGPAGQYSSAGIIKQTYNLRSVTSTYLVAMGPPVSFASDQLSSVLFSPRDYLLNIRGPMLHSLNYTVTTPVIYKAGMFQDKPFVTPGDLGVTSPGLGQPGQISNTVPERITQFARTVAKELLPTPGQTPGPEKVRAIAERFQNYLRSNYPYSMKFRAVDRSVDPTEDFLFNRKSIGGHCDCFASAMVMMCRAVGINARMAAGYHGGEYNALGGFYIVKDKDAHSWVEVFVPERGWMTYDPTPAERDDGKVSAIRRWFQEVSELAQKAWLGTVVAFDNTSRKYIFNTVSAFAQAATAWVKQEAESAAAGLQNLLFGANSPLWMRLLGFAAIGMIVGATAWLGKWWQRRRTSLLPLILKTVDRKVQRQLAHDLAFVDDLLRMLGHRGRRKRAEQTPREYVEEHAGLLGHAAGDARWLIGTFYDIRFGTVHVNGATRERIGHALERVRTELQK